MRKLLLAAVCMGAMSNYGVTADCVRVDDLKVNTGPLCNKLQAWKTRQDISYLRNFSVIQLISADFSQEEYLTYVRGIYGEQNEFFEREYRLLTVPAEKRDASWLYQFCSEIGDIVDTVLQQSTESLTPALEYRALVSQQVNGLEKMLENEEITALDFCKNCWLTYLDTGIDAILKFIDRNQPLLSESDKAQFDLFKDEIAVLEEQASQ
ncbi:MAG: hypothetical protein LBF84_02940 [Holosporales bacterium]|jgi:hypothetical protein|nr:hypothetical protein [Holosporales bacterium]